MRIETGRDVPKVLPPPDPQRICKKCHSELFFLTYATRLVTAICSRCQHPVVLSLTRSSAHSLGILMNKKGV